MESITLNNGRNMPKVGLGLGAWNSSNHEFEVVISSALEAGYRHFDTAFIYGTEFSLGKCLNEWIQKGNGKREDVFITTKLPWNGMEPKLVSHYLSLSLESLGLSYVDLYLIHWPIGVKHKSDKEFMPNDASGDLDMDHSTSIEDIWMAMEAEVDKGKALAIGISNFNISQIERILKICRIPPANLQVEAHIYFQQRELLEFCKNKRISVCAYAPLSSPYLKNEENNMNLGLLSDPILNAVAHKHNKGAGQVALKFLLNKDMAVIPQSRNKERMKLNLDLFDFNLDSEDLEKLEALDKQGSGRVSNLKMFGSKSIFKHPEFPFKLPP